MKGPGLRIELDVRRHWECPACGRRDRFLGDVVATRCPCQEGGVNMRLIENRRQVRQFDVSAFQKPHPELDPIIKEKSPDTSVESERSSTPIESDSGFVQPAPSIPSTSASPSVPSASTADQSVEP